MNKKITIASIIILLFLAVIVLIAIVFEAGKKEIQEEIRKTERQMAHPELLIEDIRVGFGEVAKVGDTVVVHYIGMLQDGSVFDNSYDKGKTFTFTLGQNRVIPGWEIGVEGVKEGGKRKLTIPPSLAYGESGVRGMVPPNSTIIFEMEVMEIKIKTEK